eukprot:12670259-Alexandrium_andersonii.AAC.1
MRCSGGTAASWAATPDSRQDSVARQGPWPRGTGDGSTTSLPLALRELRAWRRTTASAISSWANMVVLATMPLRKS